MKKSKPSKTSFKPKPTASKGMPVQGKKSGKFATRKHSGSTTHLSNDGASSSKKDRDIPRYDKNNHGFEQKMERNQQKTNNIQHSGEGIAIPQNDFDDNRQFPSADFEETIYGGHESSGRPQPGPRVTEVIQEDGQMTIEMEIDG